MSVKLKINATKTNKDLPLFSALPKKNRFNNGYFVIKAVEFNGFHVFRVGRTFLSSASSFNIQVSWPGLKRAVVMAMRQ